jgi:tetratricopeptide (TPR) repeat protein
MNAHKILLLITAGTLASTANARDRKLDIDVTIKNQAPQLAASMDQSHFLIKNRQFGLAVDALRKIIRHQPENASAYSAIAVAYDGLGRPDLARKNFEMALAYAPLEERHYRNLARHLDASGEKALAHNIMHDIEIARVQKATDDVITTPAPALDITALLTRLDREGLPVASDSPSESPDAPLPEAPANRSGAIVVADLRITSKATQALEAIATGNGEDDPKSDGSGTTIVDEDNNYSIPSTTIADVDDSIAGIYNSLGIVITDPEPDAAFLDKAMGEAGSQISETTVDNVEDRNDKITNIQSAANLGIWLEDLSKRQAHIASNSQFVERQKSSNSKVIGSQFKTAGFQLVRQSLGEVLLTSNNVDWLVSHPTRTAGVNFNSRLAQMKVSTRPDNASQYFAAIRSVFDSGENRIAVASSDLLADVALKQLEVAMAELAKKRHSRLPRIDQGPSSQLRQIAVTLYKQADSARRSPVQPAKQNVRVALFYRTDTACAA